VTEHDLPGLAGYALGILAPDEARVVDEHLTGCAPCRAELATLSTTRDLLGEVPPEAFLSGPPEGGDLALQRTLRAVRAERARADRVEPGRSRRLFAVAAGIAALAVGVAVGAVIGRQTAPAVPIGAPPASSGPASTGATGVRVLAGTDQTTGVSVTVVLTPAAGWVRIHARVDGVAAGTRCQLVVTSRSGASVIAGSWLASTVGEKQGTMLDGSALVAPADVASVAVLTLDGRRLVSASA
jgi:hypothetical protein